MPPKKMSKQPARRSARLQRNARVGASNPTPLPTVSSIESTSSDDDNNAPVKHLPVANRENPPSQGATRNQQHLATATCVEASQSTLPTVSSTESSDDEDMGPLKRFAFACRKFPSSSGATRTRQNMSAAMEMAVAMRDAETAAAGISDVSSDSTEMSSSSSSPVPSTSGTQCNGEGSSASETIHSNEAPSSSERSASSASHSLHAAPSTDSTSSNSDHSGLEYAHYPPRSMVEIDCSTYTNWRSLSSTSSHSSTSSWCSSCSNWTSSEESSSSIIISASNSESTEESVSIPSSSKPINDQKYRSIFSPD